MRPNGLHSEVLQTAMKEAGMWIWKFRDPKSEMKSHCHALLFQTAMHPVIIYCHRLLCIQLSSIQTFKPTGRPVGVPIQKETAYMDEQATTNPTIFLQNKPSPEGNTAEGTLLSLGGSFLCRFVGSLQLCASPRATGSAGGCHRAAGTSSPWWSEPNH